MIKKFAKYYKPHLGLFILDLACALTVAVCNLVYPRVAGDIIRRGNEEYVLVGAAILLGIFALKAALNYVINYYGHVVGVRIQGDMRAEMFAHLQKLPFSYYDETKTGSVMSRLINDLFEISELAHHGPEDVFLSLVSIAGALVMIFFISPWLSLILLAVLPAIMLIAARLRIGLVRSFDASREKTAVINSEVESAVSGIRVSKAYTAEAHEAERFAAANGQLQEARRIQYKAISRFNTAMTFAMDFLYLVAFAAGGIFFARGAIDAADLTSYVLYVSMLIAPIRTFAAIFEQIQDGATGFKRFLEVMAVPEEKETDKPVSAGRLKGDIEFRGVTFGYASKGDKFVIKDLTLSIGAGKTVALVGPSGGGKTTFCNLIPRFYEVTSGEITIDGINIKDMTFYDLRRNIGIVQQDVFIFAGTVRENIAYGDFSADDARITEAAKLAGIHDFIMTLDDGYDSYVGERGVKLSGGQRQRIAIARAFLKNPPVLILDEATSALDNVTEMQIRDALDRLSVGRTTIVVAHRLSTVKNADEIIVFDKDGVKERGTHDELMKTGGTYSVLYNYQFRDKEDKNAR